MIDYVMISADIGERVIEYVDHLHEHFVDPVRISRGAYQVPTQQGFSVRMLEESIEKYRYPDGSEWRLRLNARKAAASNE
jgi:L-fuconate dehydratase